MYNLLGNKKGGLQKFNNFPSGSVETDHRAKRLVLLLARRHTHQWDRPSGLMLAGRRSTGLTRLGPSVRKIMVRESVSLRHCGKAGVKGSERAAVRGDGQRTGPGASLSPKTPKCRRF